MPTLLNEFNLFNFLHALTDDSQFQNGYAITKVDSLKEKPQDVSETNIINLINAMNVEIPPNKLSSHFSNMTKKNSASCTPCRVALIQLENLVQLLTSLKIKVCYSQSMIATFYLSPALHKYVFLLRIFL